METSNAEVTRLGLERVLASLSRFLKFIVERSLEGRASELKESVIAIEVFGRKPDYDPKLDSIVRTTIGHKKYPAWKLSRITVQ